MAPPALALNDEDAALIGAMPGELLNCAMDGGDQQLALEIHPELPRGVAGIAGLTEKAHALPGWVCIGRIGPGTS